MGVHSPGDTESQWVPSSSQAVGVSPSGSELLLAGAVEGSTMPVFPTNAILTLPPRLLPDSAWQGAGGT